MTQLASTGVVPSLPDSTPLLELSEGVEDVGRSLVERQALGCIFVAAGALEDVERGFGFEAFQRSLGNLGSLLRQICRDSFAGKAWVLRGEVGRAEVAIFLSPEAYFLICKKFVMIKCMALIDSTKTKKINPIMHHVFVQKPFENIG